MIYFIRTGRFRSVRWLKRLWREARLAHEFSLIYEGTVHDVGGPKTTVIGNCLLIMMGLTVLSLVACFCKLRGHVEAHGPSYKSCLRCRTFL